LQEAKSVSQRSPTPDPAAVDLLDDRVQQVVVGEQVLEVGAG